MSEETKVTRKDLHEKLWESRSFEINHLWQRSIFLATFIVALFTLYFSVLNLYYTELNSPKAHAEQSLEAKNENDSSIPENGKQESSEDEQKTKYNAAIFFVLETICFFGFQFSVLFDTDFAPLHLHGALPDTVGKCLRRSGSSPGGHSAGLPPSGNRGSAPACRLYRSCHCQTSASARSVWPKPRSRRHVS